MKPTLVGAFLVGMLVACAEPADDTPQDSPEDVTAPPRSDVNRLQWGETLAANNADDSRTLSFEVRKKGGGCAKLPWTLLVQGNL